MPITGARVLIVGLQNEFQASWLPLSIFFIVFLKPAPSSWNCLGVNVIYFWLLHPLLPLISWNFNISPLLFRSHDAEFDIDEQWLFLHFPVFMKSSPRVIYLLKVCDLFRLPILQVPPIILTSFCVLGFTFSCLFWSMVSL